MPYQSWVEVPAPMFRIRGEPLPVKRMPVTVRSKRFKAYVVSAQTPGVVGIAAIRHASQRRIER